MTIEEIVRKKATQSISNYKVASIGFDKNGKILGTAFNHPFMDGHGRGAAFGNLSFEKIW